MTNKQKLFLTGLSTLIGCYFLICTFFYFMQVKIIFGPSPISQNAEYSFPFPFEERFFSTGEDVNIHAIHAKADSGKGLVIYFHGNRGNNNSHANRYTLFLKNNYDVLYPDYRGYGKSTGKIWDEADIMNDARYIYQQMQKEYEEENIVLVGYSLGTGVAAQLAAVNNPKSLVLWAPYYSLLDMKDASYPFLPDFLVRFPFRTDVAMQQTNSPVYIFYAENDKVLPMKRSLRLTDFLEEDDGYFILKGQGHGWLLGNAELKYQMENILSD